MSVHVAGFESVDADAEQVARTETRAYWSRSIGCDPQMIVFAVSTQRRMWTEGEMPRLFERPTDMLLQRPRPLAEQYSIYWKVI